eukprot:6420988-Amphidinium_carterae.1
MRHFDTRKDGQVSYNEFCDAMLEEDYHTEMIKLKKPLDQTADSAYEDKAKNKTAERVENEKASPSDMLLLASPKKVATVSGLDQDFQAAIIIALRAAEFPMLLSQ